MLSDRSSVRYDTQFQRDRDVFARELPPAPQARTYRARGDDLYTPEEERSSYRPRDLPLRDDRAARYSIRDDRPLYRSRMLDDLSSRRASFERPLVRDERALVSRPRQYRAGERGRSVERGSRLNTSDSWGGSDRRYDTPFDRVRDLRRGGEYDQFDRSQRYSDICLAPAAT